MGRCSGLCCLYFCMGPPDTLKEKIEREMRWGPHDEDTRLVKDLLIYRGEFTNPYNNDAGEGHWYTCRAYNITDGIHGDCSIYESRPKMCRVFPENYRDDKCPYPDCTYDKEAPVAEDKEDRLIEESITIAPALPSYPGRGCLGKPEVLPAQPSKGMIDPSALAKAIEGTPEEYARTLGVDPRHFCKAQCEDHAPLEGYARAEGHDLEFQEKARLSAKRRAGMMEDSDLPSPMEVRQAREVLRMADGPAVPQPKFPQKKDNSQPIRKYDELLEPVPERPTSAEMMEELPHEPPRMVETRRARMEETPELTERLNLEADAIFAAHGVRDAPPKRKHIRQPYEMKDLSSALFYMIMAGIAGEMDKVFRWSMFIQTTFQSNTIKKSLAAMLGIDEDEARCYLEGASVPLPVRR